MDQRPGDLPDPSAMADAHIRRRGLEAPPAEPDEHDLPVDLDPATAVDLRAERVVGVVWCAGFDGDFSFLDPAAWSTPTGGRAARTPPGPCPARGTWGCAGCVAAAPGSCSASPGTPPWSPRRSGRGWPAEF